MGSSKKVSAPKSDQLLHWYDLNRREMPWRSAPGQFAIGASLLLAYWKDPDFDAKERAFYYVRVIEIPTPRWTTYDAKYFKVKLPDGAPTAIQDRAYTSPIWYTP